MQATSEGVDAIACEIKSGYAGDMARTPRKPEGDLVTKRPQFTLRMPDDLREELGELAEAEGRSLANYILRALREHIDSKRRVDEVLAAAAPAATKWR